MKKKLYTNSFSKEIIASLIVLIYFVVPITITAQPTIQTVSPNPVCLGGEITIRYTGTGPITQIRFIDGDGDQIGATLGGVRDPDNPVQTAFFTIPNNDALLETREIKITSPTGGGTSSGFLLTVCKTNIVRTNPITNLSGTTVCQGEILEIIATFPAGFMIDDVTNQGMAIEFKDIDQNGGRADFIENVPIGATNIVLHNATSNEWKITVTVPATRNNEIPADPKLREEASISILHPYNSGTDMGTSLGAYKITVCADKPEVLEINNLLISSGRIPVYMQEVVIVKGNWFRRPFSINIGSSTLTGDNFDQDNQPRTFTTDTELQISTELGDQELTVTSVNNKPKEKSISDVYNVEVRAPRPKISETTPPDCDNGVLTIVGEKLQLNTGIKADNEDLTVVVFHSDGMTPIPQPVISELDETANEIKVNVPSGLGDNVFIEVAVLHGKDGESRSEKYNLSNAILENCKPNTPQITKVNTNNRICLTQTGVTATATVTGSDFTASSVVRLNGLEMTISSRSGTNSISFEVPDGLSQGSATIVVSNGDFGDGDIVSSDFPIIIAEQLNAQLTPMDVSCNMFNTPNFNPNLNTNGSIKLESSNGMGAGSASNVFSYVFTSGSSRFGTVLLNENIPNLEIGTYNIIIEDEDGCRYKEENITIREPDSFTVKISTPSIPPGGCALGEQATITALPSKPASYSYVWKIGGRNIGTTQTVSLENGNNQYSVEIDINGCKADTTSPQINGASAVIISGLKPTYCIGDQHDDITLSPTEGEVFLYDFTRQKRFRFDLGVRNMLSIIPKSNGTSESILIGGDTTGFSLPPGEYYISYRKDLGADIPCPQIVATNFWISEKPIVEIDRSNLDPNYCQRFRQIDLKRTPSSDSASVFIGPGVVNTNLDSNTFQFIPLLAPDTTHDIILTHSNNLGCTSSDTVKITVVPLPNVDFLQYKDSIQDTIFCVRDTILFEDPSNASGDSLSKREWIFGDGNRDNIKDTNAIIQHVYDEAGVFTVILDKKNTDDIGGCDNRKDQQIIIGDRPMVNFGWQNICFGDNTQFFDLTTMDSIIYPKWIDSLKTTIDVKDSIINWHWSFGDDSTSNEKNPIHEYKNPGEYRLFLEVTTSLNCVVTKDTVLNILPSIVVDENSIYDESFDTAAVWVPEVFNPLWQWTTSDSLNMAADQRAWITITDSIPGYHIGDTSALYSPCFNLTGLSRPKIEITIYVDTDIRRDGVQLQYSNTGLEDWITLGEIFSNGDSTGIHWYNRNGEIPSIGSPDHGLFGWSGPDSIWKKSVIDGIWQVAMHRLDITEGTVPVKFRLLFSSSGDGDTKAEGLKGFALDRVRITNREKTVLSEHFTNPPGNSEEEEHQKELVDDNTDTPDLKGRTDIVNLKYKLGFPTPYATGDYRKGPMARSLYYGISQSEVTIIGGNHYRNLTKDLSQNDLDLAMLKDPDFYIDEVTKNGNDRIDIKITARKTFNQPQEIMLFAVAVDTTENLNKVRNMFPNPAGEIIEIDSANIWTENDQKSITVPWDCNSDDNLVVFLQDYLTKEVYQAAFFTSTEVCENREGRPDEGPITPATPSISIYPNPSTSHFNLSFNWTLEEDINWNIIDGRGRKVDSGRLDAGQSKYKIGGDNWAEGIYILQLYTKELGHIRKKLILMH